MKSEFVSYVRRMKDATVRLDGGASEPSEGVFDFPFVDGSGFDGAHGILRFGGSVHFTGHFGMLSVFVADPWIEITTSGVIVSIRDDDDHTSRIPFVTVEIAVEEVHELLNGAELPTRLTAEAADLFFDNYRPGDAAAPITARLP